MYRRIFGKNVMKVKHQMFAPGLTVLSNQSKVKLESALLLMAMM